MVDSSSSGKIPNLNVVTREEHSKMHSIKCATCVCTSCSRKESCRCAVCGSDNQSKLSCDVKVLN